MVRQLILVPLCLVFLLGSVLLPGCVAQENGSVASREEELRLHQVVRIEFDLPTTSGRIHTRVAGTLANLLRRDRDLIVLVSGSLANGASYFDLLSGSGYNTLEILAREGYIVAAPDLPGTGENNRLADGSVVDTEFYADAIRAVSRALRLTLHTRQTFLYGETGVGSNVCLLLAREHWVRGIVVSSPAYMQFGPVGAFQLFDPGWIGFLQSMPDGYLPLAPATFAPFLVTATPEVAAAATTGLLGPAPHNVPTGPLLEVYAHAAPDSLMTGRLATPVVAAEPAIAPALFIQGDPDLLGSVAGTEELVDAYGGEAELVLIGGATHLMRFDDVISDGPDSEFWEATLEFLDSH